MPTPQDAKFHNRLNQDIQDLNNLGLLRHHAGSMGDDTTEFDQRIREVENAIEARMTVLRKGKEEG